MSAHPIRRPKVADPVSARSRPMPPFCLWAFAVPSSVNAMELLANFLPVWAAEMHRNTQCDGYSRLGSPFSSIPRPLPTCITQPRDALPQAALALGKSPGIAPRIVNSPALPDSATMYRGHHNSLACYRATCGLPHGQR